MTTPHPRFINLVGQTFGRLTVISRAPNSRGHAAWNVQCVCETSLIVRGYSLRQETTKSCGCLRRDVTSKANATHGMAGRKKTPTYKSWENMKKRCTNPHNRDFRHYGGRGISICARWQDFTLFLADMGRRPSPQHSLDRIDNAGNYEPENCRWTTPKEQHNNTRRNVRLTYHGVTLTVAQWAERIGIKSICLFMRLRRGWSIERALTPPPLTRSVSK